MAKQNFLNGLFSNNLEKPQNKTIVEVHEDPIGTSGVENYAGYLQEEFLTDLQGTDAAEIYDKMRRTDSTIKMNLSSVMNPIKSGDWYIKPASEDEIDQKVAAQISWSLFEGMDKSWSSTLNEILTMITYGYSLFEITHKVVKGHSEFGDFIGVRSFGYRSQKTIERFFSDYETGELLGVEQQSFGDLQRFVTIPADFLLLFTLDQEGDNFEGISLLRSVYGAWKRKQAYLKLMAIGVEKYSVPMPVLSVPEDKQGTTQFTKAVAVLRKYITHQLQYITKPAGWEIDFPTGNFDPSKLRDAIEFENKEISRGFMANFLELGQGQSGSYALSNDLSDFFLGQLQHVANQICETINAKLLPNLTKLNFGPNVNPPKLVCSNITDKPGSELAGTLKTLIDSKIVVPDDELEKNIRQRYRLPEKSEEGQREVQSQPQSFGFSESKVMKLADGRKGYGQIKSARDELSALMHKHLVDISKTQIDKIMKKASKLPKSQQLMAIKNLNFTGKAEYLSELRETLARISYEALKQAREEVPTKKNVKLSEYLDSVTFAEFEKLPPDLRKQVSFLSDLIVGTQLNDLEKNLTFKYQSTVELDSDAARKAELLESAGVSQAKVTEVRPVIMVAASNLSAEIINSARNAFFFTDDVLEDVASFTFFNPDPVSAICQELNGQTFSADDPDFRKFEPPLHHNCKSVFVPNLKGTKAGSKPIEKLGPKDNVAAALKSITLSEAGDLTLVSVLVSKKVARTRSEAISLIQQFKGGLIGLLEETEDSYRVDCLDLNLINQGSLKSFSPVMGVHLLFGTLKATDYEDQTMQFQESDFELQTVVISKEVAKSVSQAKRLAKEVGAKRFDKVDETDDSYRFRQRDPGEFKEGSFRSKKIEQKGATLVYGRLK